MALPGLTPSLALQLGISPSSNAATGLDYMGGFGGAATGAVNFGSDGTAVSGVIKDAATVIAVILGAMFLYKRLK